MSLHPAEEATIRAFFLPGRRTRFIEQLGSLKGREKALNALNRFDYLDPRWMAEDRFHTSGDICEAMRAAGAPAECHLISDDALLDGRDMPLEKAVDAAQDFDFASILCGLPGRVAFAFGEATAPRLHALLLRPE